MIRKNGNLTTTQSTTSQNQSANASTSTITTSGLTLIDPNTILAPPGGSSNDWLQITPGEVIHTVGAQATQPPQVQGSQHMSLVKTGAGEFMLSGNNAQQLLMEYFEQSPELWLRLLALKAGEEDGKPAPKD